MTAGELKAVLKYVPDDVEIKAYDLDKGCPEDSKYVIGAYYMQGAISDDEYNHLMIEFES